MHYQRLFYLARLPNALKTVATNPTCELNDHHTTTFPGDDMDREVIGHFEPRRLSTNCLNACIMIFIRYRFCLEAQSPEIEKGYGVHGGKPHVDALIDALVIRGKVVQECVANERTQPLGRAFGRKYRKCRRVSTMQ